MKLSFTIILYFIVLNSYAQSDTRTKFMADIGPSLKLKENPLISTSSAVIDHCILNKYIGIGAGFNYTYMNYIENTFSVVADFRGIFRANNSYIMPFFQIGKPLVGDYDQQLIIGGGIGLSFKKENKVGFYTNVKYQNINYDNNLNASNIFVSFGINY